MSYDLKIMRSFPVMDAKDLDHVIQLHKFRRRCDNDHKGDGDQEDAFQTKLWIQDVGYVAKGYNQSPTCAAEGLGGGGDRDKNDHDVDETQDSSALLVTPHVMVMILTSWHVMINNVKNFHGG